MGTFKDTLKKWFYTSGNRKMAATRRICLLDANGNPIGSDTIENIRSLVAPLEVDSSKYVDMGLPSGTLWAKCNIGAYTEKEEGWYCSWGNPDMHPRNYDFSPSNYNASTGKTLDGNITMPQDAASMTLGRNWRIPSKDHYDELLNSTYTDFVDANGNVITTDDKRILYGYTRGVMIRSKANGNTLFFPAAGVCYGTTCSNRTIEGWYWTTSFYNSSYAYAFLYNNNGSIGFTEQPSRVSGLSIRPIINK